jgi:hypothetical protein
VGGQLRIGVQKEKDVARCLGGCFVELPTAWAGRRDDARTQRMRSDDLATLVHGASVRDENLEAARQTGDVVEKGAEDPSLVQDRNHDAHKPPARHGAERRVLAVVAASSELLLEVAAALADAARDRAPALRVRQEDEHDDDN